MKGEHMAKVLTEYEKNRRKDNVNYFSNGKPKKSAMLCKTKKYIAEVTAINGICNPAYICGGNRCPLYATGCDNRGKDWEK